jgi:hypothetical protein
VTRTSPSRAWIFIVLFSTLVCFAQAQGRKNGSARRMNYDFPVNLNLEDLNGASSTLQLFRKDREKYCSIEQGKLGKSNVPLSFIGCSWHRPIPKSLERVSSSGISGEISVIEPTPYTPLKLSRKQDSLFLKSLVPIDQVADGTQLLKSWKDEADEGELFDCVDPDFANSEMKLVPQNIADDAFHRGITTVSINKLIDDRHSETAKTCLVIVRNNANEDNTYLGLCQVLKVGQHIGAPEQCFPIAATLQSRSWILAITGSYYALLAMNGQPDFSYNIFQKTAATDTHLQSGPTMGLSDLSRAIEKALSSPPLSMQTSSTPYIIGVIDGKPSKVIPGHPFETVTVTIFIKDNPDYKGSRIMSHNFDLTVSTTVLVNAQNTDNPYDLHSVSLSQNKIWVDAVRSRLQQEIFAICPHPNRKDDFSVVCSDN